MKLSQRGPINDTSCFITFLRRHHFLGSCLSQGQKDDVIIRHFCQGLLILGANSLPFIIPPSSQTLLGSPGY